MIIAGRANAPVGEENLVDEENILLQNEDGSQFLNDSGEGIEVELPLTNSGEVC